MIVACDAPDLAQTLRLARTLRGVVHTVKVGSVLFTAAGPAAITQLQKLGFRVFLDLKFHDIPSTVERSCDAAARHGVWMLTVHACGQREMLEAAMAGARRGARAGSSRPKIVGVTVLTSVGSGKAVGVAGRALALAVEAKRAGLDGVVASAHEAAAIRRRVGPRALIVCPGIRPASATHDDQARVASPMEAVARGADFLVVGRPIAGAADPRRAAVSIIEEIRNARS